MRRGRKKEAAQRSVQSARGDGGAVGGEDPGGTVVGVWGPSDDDQHLEAGADEACERVVGAWQQGAGGRRCAEGHRRSAPQDRPVTGRTRFSSRAARHLPPAERRAMIAPNAGLSVSRQCTLLGIARSSFYYQSRPTSADELDLLNRLDRIFTEHPVYGSRRLQVALVARGDFRRTPAHPTADAQAGAVRGQAEAEHQQAAPASRAQDLSLPAE